MTSKRRTYVIIGQCNWQEFDNINRITKITHKVPATLKEARLWASVVQLDTKVVVSKTEPSCPWGHVLYVWRGTRKGFEPVGFNADSSG